MGMRIDLGSLLEKQANEQPTAQFVSMVRDGIDQTYGEFNEAVNRVAHGLAARGVEGGTFVGLMLWNSLEFMTASYALKKLGAVEVAINAEFRGPGLIRMLNLAECKMLITAGEFLEPLSEVCEDLMHLETLVLTDDLYDDAAPVLRDRKRLPYAELMSSRSDDPLRNVQDTDVAAILFTSGTTGLSKGCMIPHRAAIRMAEGAVEALRLTSDDCTYTPWPLFHGGAAYHEVLPALLTGGRVAISRRFSASRFWDEVRGCGATVFLVMGAVQKILWSREASAHDRNHNVRICWGGPFPVDRNAFHQRFGIRTLHAYGLTDSGMPSWEGWEDPPGLGDKIRDSLYEVQIVDESDDQVSPGNVGEIVLRPREPDVMLKGYYGNPEYTLHAFRNLWFHTGDLGRITADNRLIFLGRKKQVIRRRGDNILAEEVEEVVDGHPDVLESCAVAVASDLGEDEVKVFVLRVPGASVTDEELRMFCASRMARYMIPKTFEFIDEMPRTPTGKPARSALSTLANASGSATQS